MPPLSHALSVDVEDWNNGALLLLGDRVVPPTRSVVDNTERLLELFQQCQVRATWFVLGDVADAYPELVRKLGEAGHEIGVHGYHHFQVHRLSRERFRDDICLAKEAVERASGKEARGHRAVAFSIGEQTWDALDILAQAGFRYDSSVFPFSGRRYGTSRAPLSPWWVETARGKIMEIPMSVVQFGPFRFPCSGGGYLRHFPLLYTRFMLRILQAQARSAVLYLHPYEIDTTFDAQFFRQYPVPVSPARFRLLRFLQYRNRRWTKRKLRWLFQHHQWGPIEEVFKACLADEAVKAAMGPMPSRPG